MPTHRYVSALRSGLGALADRATDDRPRLTVDVTVDAQPDDPISAELAIAGPGDVRGLATDQIIGRTPTPGSEDAEPNVFAAVQFATPDLPWLFSLAPNEDRGTTPWLALVVVPEHAAELRTPGSSPSAVLAIPRDAGRHLPDPAQLWAWAHVREVVPGGDPQAGGVGGALAASPRTRVAQLLCPRLLAPETDHLAAVVPVYEAGRRQGLGQDLDEAGAAFAWSVPDADGVGGTDALELPAYDHWRFRTSARGDFASLARLLAPAKLPDNAGSRSITVREPAPDALIGRTFELRAPLGSPALGAPDDLDAATPLRQAVEAAEDVLTPPARGNEHAGATTLPDQGWRAQANLHPTYRAAAGIAAEVVRGLEEELVAAAREQAGDLEGVNALLGRSQLSRALGHRFHERLRTIAAADPATLLDVAAPVHHRVRLDGATAATTLAGSHLVGVGDVGWTRGSRRMGRRSRTTGALQRLAAAGPRVLDPEPPPGCETAPRRPLPRKFGPIPAPDGHERQYPLDRNVPKVPDLVGRKDADPTAYRGSAAAQAARAAEDLSRPGARAARADIDVAARAEELLARLDPEVTVTARTDARLEVPEALRDPSDRLGEVRVAPEIVRPLALEVGAVSDDLLLSGLSDLAPDRITAAVPDDAVAAASMLGANEQLLRMLRWRRFPVPHAWTPLRRFWPRPGGDGGDPAPDTAPIDSWSAASPLAANLAGDVELVVLLRGELLRRYPDTVVAMVAGRFEDGEAVPSNSSGRTTPLFRANLPPDVTVMGFGVDPAAAMGSPDPQDGAPGWFLLLQEPSQSPVHGLAEPRVADTARDPGSDDPLVGLSWRDVGVERGEDHPFAPVQGRLSGATDTEGRSWGATSAQQAGITLQRTTRVYVHLAELLGA